MTNEQDRKIDIVRESYCSLHHIVSTVAITEWYRFHNYKVGLQIMTYYITHHSIKAREARAQMGY